MQEFQLNGQEYIELNKLLKHLKFVGSGSEANAIIDEGLVIVNGKTETRRRNKLRTGDKVVFEENIIQIVA